jgi:hypothetical protein
MGGKSPCGAWGWQGRGAMLVGGASTPYSSFFRIGYIFLYQSIIHINSLLAILLSSGIRACSILIFYYNFIE